uniref:Protein kinase domain-containing protein n=1 Tax=Oryza brachyantha TaxID=4533 RepID=J3LS63_ORYBR
MALIREKRFTQMNLSLHVPSRAPLFQEAAARRQCPPPSTSMATPASRSNQFRLADFERVAVLGRGNGGTVYKVRHRETCALYALKVQHSGEPAAAEADILSRMASPFVVRCHSVLPTASGDVALLLELADGGSVDAVVGRRGAFPEAAVAEVAAQALSALADLHARRCHQLVSIGVYLLRLLLVREGGIVLRSGVLAEVNVNAFYNCVNGCCYVYCSSERAILFAFVAGNCIGNCSETKTGLMDWVRGNSVGEI